MLFNLQHKIWRKILGYKATVGFFYAIGGLDLLCFLYLRTLDARGQSRDKPTILSLNRLHFQRDTDELRLKDDHFSWIYLPEDIMGCLQYPWVPEQYRAQTFYYGKDGKGEKHFAKSEALARKIIEKLSEKWDIQGVMNANFDYWQTKGTRRACKALGLPFFVLLREVQTLPRTHAEDVEYYLTAKYKADVDLVAVANARTLNTITEEQVIDPQKIILTGLPRFDLWLNKDGGINHGDFSKKYITLLSFFDPMYYADNMFFETISVLSQAMKMPETRGLKVKIKSKSRADNRAIKKSLKEKNIDYSGFIFSHETDLKKVCQSSRIVIGYNSLAMVEAVLSDAKLIIPDWASGEDDPDSQSIRADEETLEHYHFSPTPDDMLGTIIQAIKDSKNVAQPIEKRTKFMSRYFDFSTKQTASQKFSDTLKNYIEQSDREKTQYKKSA